MRKKKQKSPEEEKEEDPQTNPVEDPADGRQPEETQTDSPQNEETKPKNNQFSGQGSVYESGDSRNKHLGPISNGKVKTGLSAALLTSFLSHQEDIEITAPIDVLGETYLYNFTNVLDRFSHGANVSVSRRSIEEIAKNILEFQSVLGLIYHVKGDAYQGGNGAPSGYTKAVKADGSVADLADWISSQTLTPGVWYNPATAKEVVVTGEELDRIVEPLKNAGMKDDQINSLLKLAMEQLDRTIIRNSFVPAALRHSLETKMFEFEKFDDPMVFNRDQVGTTIGLIQYVYSRACLQLSLDVFSQELTDVIAQDSRLKFVMNMNRFFKESTDATMPVRFSAVMEEIAPALNQDRLVEGHSIGEGLGFVIDRVTDDIMLDDVPRSVWMEYVFKMIRDFTGLAPRGERWDVVSILKRELALNSDGKVWHLGIPGDVLAARPHRAEAYYSQEQLDTLFDKLERLFRRVFLRALMKVIATRQEGLLMGRLLSVLDERAITRSETWDYVVTSGLRALSVFHQAYLDTFMFFYSIAIDMTIDMAEDDERYTPLLLEYFDQQCDVFKRTYTAINEPGHVKEASALFLGINPVPVVGDIHYAYTDDILLDYDRDNLDIFSSQYRYLYANEVLSGDRFAIPANLDDFQRKAYQWPEYSRILKPLHVKYFFVRDISSSIAGKDLTEALLRYQDVRTFYAEGVGRWFQDKCEARVYLSADDMSRELSIPLPVAESLFKNSEGMPLGYRVIFRYIGTLQQYIFFDPSICPIFEMGEKKDDDPRFYERFKARWPALVSGTANESVKPLYSMGNGAGVNQD